MKSGTVECRIVTEMSNDIGVNVCLVVLAGGLRVAL